MSEEHENPYEDTIFETVEVGDTPATFDLDTTMSVPTGFPLERERRIGKYRLETKVGEGGQGQVWLAENLLAARPVALKFLPAALASDEKAMAALRGEAGVLFDLTHEQIVRLMNIEQEDGYAFLVMEYLEGASLQDLFKRRQREDKSTFTVDECLWMLNQLAPALDYANAKGITHRDIKPANVMLDKPVEDGPLNESDAVAKLCDFGIAFVANTNMAKAGHYDPMGTLWFIAPELLHRQQPTPAADIYSLAATLYYLVKGEPPIKGKMPDLLARVKHDTPAPLDSGNAEFDAAIALALSKDPELRPRSADDLLQRASGGRMGKIAQKKANSLRSILLTALTVGIAAGGYISWRFSVAGEQATFTSPAAGAVVNTDTINVAFDIEDLDIKEVSVGILGYPATDRVVGRSADGRFQGTIPLPEPDGELNIEVKSPEGKRSFGNVSFLADRRVLSGTQPVRTTGKQFALGSAAALAFDFREPVTIRLAETDRATMDETSGRTAGLTFLHGNFEDGDYPFKFLVADAAGNQAEYTLTLELFDEGGLLGGFADSFPLPADGAWHPWQLEELSASVTDWERRFAGDDRLGDEEKTRLLEQDGRGDLRRLLAKTLAERPVATLRLDPGSAAVEMESSVRRLHTRSVVFELTGSVDDSRSKDLRCFVGGSNEPQIVSLDRESGRFTQRLPVVKNGTLELRFEADGMTQPEFLHIVHDDVLPEISDVTLDARTRKRTVPLTLRVVDAHPDKVVVLDASRAEYALQKKGDTWSGNLELSGEGEHDFVLVATDRAGNEKRVERSVQCDQTPPRLKEKDGVPTELQSGQEVTIEWSAGEAVGAFEAAVSFEEADGTLVPVVPTQRVEENAVALTFTTPDRAGREVRVTLKASDLLGNESESSERVWPVRYDPWGAVPPVMRAFGEIVSGPKWSEELDGWTDYVVDQGARYPRCIRHRKTGLEFVYVPSGTFELGSEDSDNEEARRVVQVEMSGFYISRTEVSKGQFARLDGGAVEQDAEMPQKITFDEADEWCARAQLRLPTEAQWEYAASGPENNRYPWGRAFDAERLKSKPRQEGTFARGAPPEPAAVGEYPGGASWCFAFQMSGNLFEYCRDLLQFSKITAGSVDPIGSISSASKLARGGSHNVDDERKLRTDFRLVEPGTLGGRRSNGFRPVWEVSR